MQANTIKYKQLRSKYVWFAYEDFSFEKTNDQIIVRFHFNLADHFHFHPKLIFYRKDFLNQQFPDKKKLDNLIFHLGMIELISYWKAACPPKLIIKPYLLDENQIKWWKKLYYKGLGEFFYLNGIETSQNDFIEIEVESDKKTERFDVSMNERVLVPIGGGKDSIVTLELLKKNFEIDPFILNPRGASLQTTRVAGFPNEKVVVVHRFLDKKLLELNDRGFLNGHTPFSAMLAFVSLISSLLGGFKHIALSNEASANEPTEIDSGVNHQYSKSLEFENDFRWYVEKYISPDLDYFSFLRPLSELQIAKIFSGFPKYFPVFKSCNVGSKSDIWCGSCPKCLFTNIILSPFIDQDARKAIFGKDLFEDIHLRRYLNELTGISNVKPFECVGTLEEVNQALSAVLSKYSNSKLPVLLKYYMSNKKLHNKYKEHDLEIALRQIENEHCLSDVFLEILKNGLVEA